MKNYIKMTHATIIALFLLQCDSSSKNTTPVAKKDTSPETASNQTTSGFSTLLSDAQNLTVYMETEVEKQKITNASISVEEATQTLNLLASFLLYNSHTEEESETDKTYETCNKTIRDKNKKESADNGIFYHMLKDADFSSCDNSFCSNCSEKSNGNLESSAFLISCDEADKITMNQFQATVSEGYILPKVKQICANKKVQIYFSALSNYFLKQVTNPNNIMSQSSFSFIKLHDGKDSPCSYPTDSSSQFNCTLNMSLKYNSNDISDGIPSEDNDSTQTKITIVYKNVNIPSSLTAKYYMGGTASISFNNWQGTATFTENLVTVNITNGNESIKITL